MYLLFVEFDVKSIVIWRQLSYNFVKNSLLSFFPICLIHPHIRIKNQKLPKSISLQLNFWACITLSSTLLGCEGALFTNTMSLWSFFSFLLLSLAWEGCLGWEGTFFKNTTLSPFLCSLFNLSLGWNRTFTNTTPPPSFFCFVLLLSVSLGW